MNDEIIVLDNQQIQDRIYTIRGEQVMIDRDLANLYGVETKYLNRAVKRNIERFSKSFRFQLTEEEFENWKSQIVTSNHKTSLRFQNGTLETSRGKHTKYLPHVFTEQGVAMLSAVLRSQTAIQVSIQIIKSFCNYETLYCN